MGVAARVKQGTAAAVLPSREVEAAFSLIGKMLDVGLVNRRPLFVTTVTGVMRNAALVPLAGRPRIRAYEARRPCELLPIREPPLP